MEGTYNAIREDGLECNYKPGGEEMGVPKLVGGRRIFVLGFVCRSREDVARRAVALVWSRSDCFWNFWSERLNGWGTRTKLNISMIKLFADPRIHLVLHRNFLFQICYLRLQMLWFLLHCSNLRLQILISDEQSGHSFFGHPRGLVTGWALFIPIGPRQPTGIAPNDPLQEILSPPMAGKTGRPEASDYSSIYSRINMLW